MSEKDEDRSDSGREHGRDQVAEELRLLIDALAFRAEDFLRKFGYDSGSCAESAAGDSGDGRSCGWCPVCAVAAIVRGERPELTARLAEQLSGLVTLLREIMAEQHRNPPPESQPAQPDSGMEPPTTGKVQKIAVQRVSGRVLREEEPASQGRGC